MVDAPNIFPLHPQIQLFAQLIENVRPALGMRDK